MHLLSSVMHFGLTDDSELRPAIDEH